MKKTTFIWIPRALAILFILFISLFALDAFEEGLSLGEQLLGFVIHLLPSFILLGLLLVAWRFPLVGGLLFAGAGASYFFWARGMDWTTYLLVAGPPLLIGAFFIAGKTLRER